MTELDSYLVKLLGGGLVGKILWDWLKYGRGNANKNGSKPASTLTTEVLHLKETCSLKHKTEDERYMETNKKLDKLDEGVQGVHKRLDLFLTK